MKDGLDDIDDILTELDAYVRDEEERKKQRPDATASSSDPVLAPGGRKGSALQIALQQVRDGAASLDLSHWSIRLGNDGASALSESLQRGGNQQRLKSILLNCNDIGPKGATFLSKALRENHTLGRLHLTSNFISDSGTEAIAEALRSNNTLTLLDLESNSIGASGASALADMLRVNLGLLSLHLSDNTVGDSGAAALGNALSANKTLITLWLDGNKIGVSGGGALSAALVSNKTVQTIHLGAPRIGSTIHVYFDK